MVLGFVRHILKYFAVREDGKDPDAFQSNTGRLLMYDEAGTFIGYAQHRPGAMVVTDKSNDIQPQPGGEVLYRRTSTGKFVAVHSLQEVDKKEPRKKEPLINDARPAGLESVPSLSDIFPDGWDGWPMGDFTCFVTHEEYEATGGLKVHWAHKTQGGKKSGQLDSLTWQGGKESIKACRGALRCNNPNCGILIRPKVREAAIQEQLLTGCTRCNSSLERILCKNRAVTHRFTDGVYYQNGDDHTHDKLPNVIGLLPSQKKQLEDIITSHPKSGPPQRLWPGRGALARHGVYFYPVRLLEKQANNWLVRWWRENIYEGAPPTSYPISLVAESDIVDSLWNDPVGRRQIRLGQWKHAYLVDTVEDILANPGSVQYTDTTDTYLRPYLQELEILVVASLQKSVSALGSGFYPAKQFLEDQKKPIFDTDMPYFGALSTIQRAEISNWFYTHLIGDQRDRQHKWFGYLPYSHATTRYICGLLKETGHVNHLDDNRLLKRAWAVQYNELPSFYAYVDVDMECIDWLEQEMFEVSERAGVAGNHQWGLDAGDHQYWYPYAECWNTGDRTGDDDDELEVGPKYISNPPRPQPEAVHGPRPKPRIRQKKELNSS